MYPPVLDFEDTSQSLLTGLVFAFIMVVAFAVVPEALFLRVRDPINPIWKAVSSPQTSLACQDVRDHQEVFEPIISTGPPVSPNKMSSPRANDLIKQEYLRSDFTILARFVSTSSRFGVPLDGLSDYHSDRLSGHFELRTPSVLSREDLEWLSASLERTSLA